MEPDRKQLNIDLWRTCFDDSEAFIDLYFDRVYSNANTLTVEKNGQVVSALQMLPHTMTYCGTEISVSYIYGACTSPLHRRLRLMEMLLQQAFEIMKRRGVVLTVLIPSEPWLFDYYRRLGYSEAFDYTLSAYSRPNNLVQVPGLSVTPSEGVPTEQLYTYFDRKLRERPCCVLHTPSDFEVICRSLQISGGQLLVASNDKKEIAGIAFALPGETGAYISELLYDSPEAKELLLQEATIANNTDNASYRTTPSLPGATPLGMAKIIDPRLMMQLYTDAHPHSPVSLQDMEAMNSDSLTQLLLNYPDREGYMSLMLD